MNIRQGIIDMAEEVTQWRRYLHQNPQLGFEETVANKLITDKLSEWGVTFESGLGGTGVVAVFEGRTNKSGQAIGIRADMDALPIAEENTFEWKSQNEGLMHACGHDGHTAMLLGLAKYLSRPENRNFDGKVYLIFQPAEEGRGGAYKMIADGLFEKYPMDAVYAAHNWPYNSEGTFQTAPGRMFANSDKLSFSIEGPGGHAAFPERSVDLMVVGSHIILALQTLISREISAMDSAVISITAVDAGNGLNVHNIFPSKIEYAGTVRSATPEVRNYLEKRIPEIVKNIAQAFNAKAGYVDYKRVIGATINDADETAFVKKLAKDFFGASNVSAFKPGMGGEDFGGMLEKVPGCYFVIGQAPADKNSPHAQGLHKPNYSFNDSIAPAGIEFFARIVEAKLKP